MRKTPDKSGPDGDAPVFTEVDLSKARTWFTKGQGLAQNKNYDYAIECYITGLEYWPEAVEEGHKPCRAAALFRGGQKVSFSDTMKYKTNLKDARKALLNAEMLLSKDPRNVGYMEAMFRNAAKAGFNLTTMWIGEIFAEGVYREEKPNVARYELLRTVYEELADRIAATDLKMAIEAMDRAVDAMSRLRSHKPTEMKYNNELRNLAGKLTILKGRYSNADSFRDSVRDSDAQMELHDKDRLFTSDSRMDDMIRTARQRYEADSGDPRNINNLVDLLCRREAKEEEREAMEILLKAFKETDEYRHKMKAEDIRIKQLKRKARAIAASGDRQAATEHLRKQLEFELGVFKERCRRYPTDLGMRFQYGVRLFQARRFDDAIPVLQEARSEPKNRVRCALYIGRSFFEKGYHSQAIDTYKDALESYETPDDELGKDLHYRLGRAYEEGGQFEEALKVYGLLLKWDYNYRNGEIRKRINDLRGQAAGGSDA